MTDDDQDKKIEPETPASEKAGDTEEGSTDTSTSGVDGEEGSGETEVAGPAKQSTEETSEQPKEEAGPSPETDDVAVDEPQKGKWYVVHTYSGHENKVATNLRQRIESEHLEHKIFDILVPTQDKIEIRAGKKEQVKEKIFPGYILVRMELDDNSWLAVRTTPGVTAFVGIGNKPTPISEAEVKS